MTEYARRLWLEEELGDDHSWKHRVTNVIFSGKSQYQEIDLVDTPTWGKVLLLDGKMQSTEADEEVYHELLVHPALLQHPNPRTVFIMGGGEGATVRECLRHKSVEKVVMVDIDKVVTDFCSQALHRNTGAFASPRLELINDDARSQLAAWPHKFDIIIGDLADPLDGGPCYQLYTQEFYRNVVLPQLNPGGIFVTQSGPCGFLSCKEVFTCINRTLASVFPSVVAYAQHIPSYCDCWGFNMALTAEAAAEAMTRAPPAAPPRATGEEYLNHQLLLPPEEIDARISRRVQGPPLKFLDGETLHGLARLSKIVREAIRDETEVYTADSARFIHGSGVAKGASISMPQPVIKACNGGPHALCGNGGTCACGNCT